MLGNLGSMSDMGVRQLEVGRRGTDLRSLIWFAPKY